MKKVFSILMVLTLLFSLAACSNNTNSEESSSPTQQSSNQSSTPAEESNSQNDSSEPTESSEQNASSTPAETAAKSLVVYFSWSGNTENVAKSIQSQTDSDIFEIVPATPYSDNYDTVVDLAQEEQRNNARPAISGSIDNIDDGADEQTDPAGPTSGTLRVYRGGGWNDFAKNMRSAYRATLEQNKGSFNLGIIP